MSNRPSLAKLAILIVGSVLFSLSTVNLFFPVRGFPRTLFAMGLVFVLAGGAIYFGREWSKVRTARIAVKTIVYTPLLAFGAFMILPFIPIQPVGAIAAHRDISAGNYRAIIPRRPWHKELAALLLNRYGIESKVYSGGCFPLIIEMTYYSGYRSVMERAIKEKYGHDVVKECTEEARSSWEKTIKEKDKS